MSLHIGINGMGVLGRRVLRMLIENNFTIADSPVEDLAINDPIITDINQLIYLLEHDTVYGTLKGATLQQTDNKKLIITLANGTSISAAYASIAYDAYGASSGWSQVGDFFKNNGVADVLDCNGNDDYITNDILSTYALSVLACVNQGSNEVPNGVFGTERFDRSYKISCVPSADLIAASVILEDINIRVGLVCGYATPIASYTNLNNLQDSAFPKYADNPQVGRAGAWNIIPIKSDVKGVGLVVPELNGLIQGLGYRCGTITGAFLELTVLTNGAMDDFIDGLTYTDGTLKSIYNERSLFQKDASFLSVSSDAIGVNSILVNSKNFNTNNSGGYISRIGVLYDPITLQAANALLQIVARNS